MLHVKVAGLSLANLGFVVLLRGEQDPRTLPIFIGGAEAQSILIHLEHVEIPRPLTHDLLKMVLDCMECRLKRVVISDLVEGTFYAVLVVERDGVETEIDARPSDAVALALRCSAPIYVVKKVIEQAGLLLAEKEADPGKKGVDGQGSALTQLKTQLETAITQERYEDAARLRDEIKKWEQGHGKN